MFCCLRPILPFCICLVLVSPVPASDLKPVENKAKMEFYGKSLLMSHYYVNNKLHFNSAGILIGQSEEGTWPTHGLVHVDDVEVKPNLVRIWGTREILTLRTQDGKLGLQPILLTKHMELELDAATPISTLEDIRRTVGNVLHEENYARKMNDYWHGLAKVTGVDPKSGQMTFEGGSRGIYGYLEKDRPVYFLNAPIQPPKVTHKEEADYTRAAAVKRTQGRTFMLVVVNEKGYPEFLHLIKDLGDDLDVQSMSGTSQWRFRPATLDGKPVACVVKVGWEFTSLY